MPLSTLRPYGTILLLGGHCFLPTLCPYGTHEIPSLRYEIPSLRFIPAFVSLRPLRLCVKQKSLCTLNSELITHYPETVFRLVVRGREVLRADNSPNPSARPGREPTN